MYENNILAVIPARGGSKRIPRKNIKNFLGKPIIAYSIETAVKSKLFNEIMVSTDDKEIAEIAKSYGAKIPFFRTKETANDFASLNDVIIEVINKYKKLNQIFNYVCLILPTAPLIKIENLIKGYKLLKNSEFDSIRPIVKYGFPIQRAFRLTEQNEVLPINTNDFKKRSQDLEPTYHDSGQFYWIKGNKDLSENKGAFEISEIEVQDIDNETDWQLAELKYKLLFNK